MTASAPIRLTCPHCGSERITRDAVAVWSAARQAWEIAGLRDAMTCETCGVDDIDPMQSPAPSTADWIAARVGTRRWVVASRLTPRLRSLGYEIAIPQQVMTRMMADYDTPSRTGATPCTG